MQRGQLFPDRNQDAGKGLGPTKARPPGYAFFDLAPLVVPRNPSLDRSYIF